MAQARVFDRLELLHAALAMAKHHHVAGQIDVTHTEKAEIVLAERKPDGQLESNFITQSLL